MTKEIRDICNHKWICTGFILKINAVKMQYCSHDGHSFRYLKPLYLGNVTSNTVVVIASKDGEKGERLNFIIRHVSS